MSSLASNKWVRGMTDYSSDDLWDKEGAAADADELPVSAALKARLSASCESYEESELYLGAHERKPFDLVTHGNNGRAIARDIKAELPDWTVVYFDEAVQRHRG